VEYFKCKYVIKYFESAGEASFSDSASVLNRGSEPITRFHLGFVLKLGLVLPVSVMGIRMGSPFVSRF